MKGQDIARESRKRITETLLELMKTQPYEKITVKALTDTAGVARLTFYRNFTDKDAVLKTHLQELFGDYLRELKPQDTLADALAVCFDYWKHNGMFTRLLVENQLEFILFRPFREYVETMLAHYGLSESLTDGQKEFIVGGLFFSMLNQTLKDDGRTSRESAKQILQVMNLPYGQRILGRAAG